MRPVIIALDYPNAREALTFINQLNCNDYALKIGNELFTACGTDFVRELVQRGFKIFLDLKFHDIPNTVASACRCAAELGVWMINMHVSGGSAMMRTARESLESFGDTRPLLIGVTVLTSMSEQDFQETASGRSIAEQVRHLSLLAYQAGLDGVVCSAHEVGAIKQSTAPDFLTVTPGIRLSGGEIHDQQRVMTPLQALQEGADYLVIGRPITKAKAPQDVLERIWQQIQ